MSARPAGLRLRLIATLTGAVLLAGALLAVPILLAVRDALYARRLAEVRQELETAARVVQGGCGYSVAMACADPFANMAGATAVLPGHCQQSISSKGAVLCKDLPGGLAVLSLQRSFTDVQGELSSLDVRLLALLGLGLGGLLALTVWLLERAVVRRLRAVDAELALVAAGGGKPELLPESGDAVANLEVSVRQLGLRLREERGRTAARIAELLTANQRLRDARAELARSERLASVGRLAAGVAHEVGNPVTALIGYAALLRERLARGQPAAEYVDRIEGEASRIDRILRDLLDLARPPPSDSAAANLPAVLAAARAALEPQAAFQGVELKLELPEGLPAVRGDEHYLAQVFVNLFANAARAGARTVRITARRSAGGVEVLVRDDGRGIKPEDLPRLFEPFFTTAAPGEGSGLGLALCHATLERFGGSIAAEQPPEGPGALFRLQLAPPE